jgi:dihydrofolate reductase
MMGRIVATVMTSIDGVTESPGEWGMRTFDEDAQRDSIKRLAISDAMLMGRLTYQALAAAWSQRQGPFADRINAIRKVVFSSTLADAAWSNATVMSGNPVEAARKLRAEATGDLTIFGFGRLARALLDADLLDELRTAVNPVLVGVGDGFGSQRSRRDMTLVSSETLPTGVVVLVYRPAAT